MFFLRVCGSHETESVTLLRGVWERRRLLPVLSVSVISLVKQQLPPSSQPWFHLTQQLDLCGIISFFSCHHLHHDKQSLYVFFPLTLFRKRDASSESSSVLLLPHLKESLRLMVKWSSRDRKMCVRHQRVKAGLCRSNKCVFTWGTQECFDVKTYVVTAMEFTAECSTLGHFSSLCN